MTSSLVGSEMCIRDRGPSRLGCRLSKDLNENRWRAYYKPFGRSISPVSYTHLTLPTICSV
eukprot:6327625-Prorocentrum_lima.AAC.1